MDVNDFPIYFFGGLYNYLSLDHDNQYTSWLIVLRLFEGMDRQNATDRKGCATNSNRKVNQKWEQCISCIDGLIQLIKGKIYRIQFDTMAKKSHM